MIRPTAAAAVCFWVLTMSMRVAAPLSSDGFQIIEGQTPLREMDAVEVDLDLPSGDGGDDIIMEASLSSTASPPDLVLVLGNSNENQPYLAAHQKTRRAGRIFTENPSPNVVLLVLCFFSRLTLCSIMTFPLL